MLSWPNLKYYVVWNGFDRKLSRPIWSTMWIRKGDIGLCHDLMWGDIWIGTDDNGCCHDQIKSALWIGKNVKGSFHDQFLR
jgi:hypothetical protein